MIFLQTERRETRNFSTSREAMEAAKQAAAAEMVTARMKTDKNMYFINSEGFLGDKHIGTVDGTHPNDLGFTHMLEVITPKIKKILKKYGFEGLENCLTEWNTEPTEFRDCAIAAAKAMSMMLGMQKKTPSLLCFYDAQFGVSIYAGLFNGETRKPRPAYYSFMMFNQAYKLENEVDTSSDSSDVFVLGAKNDKKSILLLANIGEDTEVEIEALGVDMKNAEVLMISDVYNYTPTGIDISDGKLKLPKYSCAEIRFF
jgi:hypothetical protein